VPLEQRFKTEAIDTAGLSIVPGGGTSEGAGIGSSGGKVKIFVGGLPAEVEEMQMRELFKVFGTLQECTIIRDQAGTSRGYGFVIYQDDSVVDTAIANLHNLNIKGRVLTVQRARGFEDGIMGPAGGAMPPMPSMPPMSGAPGAFGGMVPGAPMMMMGGAAGGGGAAVPVAAPPLGPGGMPLPVGISPVPTRVVAIFNMATMQDISEPAKLSDLVEDTRVECSKYGALRSVHIPRAGEVGQGAVFLEYLDQAAAVEARARLHGRAFDDRPLTAYFFREENFQARNFR
jgi:hypothetical protein